MELAQLIVLLPLVGALLAVPVGLGFGPRASEVLTTALLLICAGLSAYVFYDVALSHGGGGTVPLMTWIQSGTLDVKWALRVDSLSAVMLVVITGVSSLVHLYSIGYMHEDPDRPRFFAYLSLFTFAMLMLVTADNFLQLFFGWEGVGLASYLLIGFWFQKHSANAASIKAFVVNRVGDFGLALGMMAIFLIFGTLNFDEVFARAPEFAGQTFPFLGFEVDILTTICLLLFMGAMGKSAQFLLHTWLPDAMEGPTPVSALIHAATMVTAGVFLVVRCSPLFEYAPIALGVVTIVGAITAFFAATIALTQNDIKKVVAYSTCSQLGYMFFAAGISAYQVAMFHLFTHAFFKALLFLGAGSVIHALHHEQDMRKMGGTFKLLPLTWIFMIIGTLALTGVGLPALGDLTPPIGFAGFHSKDAALEMAYWGHNVLASGAANPPWWVDASRFAFYLGIAAAFLTSFYSWRLIFMTFHGRTRASNEVLNHAHESPPVMLIPLMTLSAGAVLAGILFAPHFIGKHQHDFWAGSIYVAKERDVVEGVHYMHKEVFHPSEHGADGHSDAAHADKPHSSDDAHSEEAHGDDTHGKEGGVKKSEGKKDKYAHFADVEVPTVTAWTLVAWSPLLVTALGLVFAIYFYLINPSLPGRIAAREGPLFMFLSHKWYFDELYTRVFVKGAQGLGSFFWKRGDIGIIDRFGPNGFAATVLAATRRIVRLQTGYIYHYAFAMLIGIAAFVTLYLAGGGGS